MNIKVFNVRELLNDIFFMRISVLKAITINAITQNSIISTLVNYN
jgi:hypothetical protein